MATLQSWRKAYGAIKDTTTLSIAKVNSEFKDLDVAVVKATNHVERPPKERHIRKIIAAASANSPRSDVTYCINALARRLSKTRNWVVALKALIVIHRTLREGDTTFRDELLHYSNKAHILKISYFRDDSSSIAWDCSGWTRTYALFLEERLECFKTLRYDIESEHLKKSSNEYPKGYSRTRNLGTQQLLEQLPALQQLLFRLVGCQPGATVLGNCLIQYALALVLKESFKIYCSINDGIINLVDSFFEMSRHEAIQALTIYQRAGELAKRLSEFYSYCKCLELSNNFQFPILREPPASFITTMEEYIKEAPKVGSFSNQTLEYHESNLLPHKQDEPVPSESLDEPSVENSKAPSVESVEEAEPSGDVPAMTGDLLGLDEISSVATGLEESNVFSGGDSKSKSTGDILGMGNSSSWELALVTTPSNKNNQPIESQLAGGFDKLLLDSLYDDAARRQQNTMAYGEVEAPYPFESMDPFTITNNIAPPPNVQMALKAQQQQQQQQYYQQRPYITIPQTYHQSRSSTNPFDDTFAAYPHPAQPL